MRYAPRTWETEGHGDTTWNLDPDCYGIIITRYGGALVHGVWRFTTIADCSALQECLGSCKVAEKLATVQDMERGIGLARDVPAVLTTDSTGYKLASGDAARELGGRGAHLLWKGSNTLLPELSLLLSSSPSSSRFRCCSRRRL